MKVQTLQGIISEIYYYFVYIILGNIVSMNWQKQEKCRDKDHA